MLRTTPFHSRTGRLNQAQAWRRWAGHVVASSYELSHEREYWAIRSSAGLLDISPLFKYRVMGRDAAALLDRVVTRSVASCAVGQVLYSPWCDDRGKVIDDGTIHRLDEQIFRLTAAEPNLHWLHRNARGMQVSIEDESERTAAVALQGPKAREILSAACDDDLTSLRFFRLQHARIGSTSVVVSRTGYTGDLGYEIWIPAQAAESVWDALIRAGGVHGVTPAGLAALDMARLEAGLILIDVDYVPALHAVIDSRKSSPFELHLGWTVKLDKDFFVGRDALAAERQRGPAWMLRGLEVDWASLESVYAEFGLPPQVPTSAWRTSVPVYAMGGQIGYATSGCWSPLLKKSIALAHLEAPFAKLGSEVWIEVTAEHRRRRARARVVDPPFFDPERKRA